MRGIDDRIRGAEWAAYAEVGARPRDRVLRVDDGSQHLDVRVTELGPDEPDSLPPVLLLHGIASATVLVAPLLPAFSGRRIVAVDWPGHGLSGGVRVERGTGVRRHAVAVLEGLLDGLGLAEVDVVGHSLGAQFALYGARDLGSRVRRVVTLGAPGAGFAGVRPIAVMKLLALPGLGPAALSVPMSDAQFRRSCAMALGPGVMEAQSPRLYRAARLAGSRRANAIGTASMFRALLGRGRVRPGVALTAEDLRRITQPVLLVWGDRDVFLTPAAAAESIDALPNAVLQQADAGHAPWLEHTEWARDLVAGFLGDPASSRLL
jgi:pimeloyl-ACP methyl ester carboxylesterase